MFEGTVIFLVLLWCIVPAEKSDLKFGHSIQQEQAFHEGEDISPFIIRILENGDIQ